MSGSLVVSTLNLRHNADEWERRAPLCAEGLLETRPHLIALQEVWRPLRQAQWLAEVLNDGLKLGPGERYHIVERPKWGFDEHRESVAVLSRLPILFSDGVDLPGGRVAVSTIVEWAQLRVEFVSVHLHFGPPDAADGIRRSQIRAMEAWLDKHAEHAVSLGAPRPRCIVAGDFNATPDKEAVALMRERYRSAFQVVHGKEPEWTFGTPIADRFFLAKGLPVFRGTLDYIFVDPELEVSSASLFCDKPAKDDPLLFASDHLGLLAEIDLPPERVG